MLNAIRSCLDAPADVLQAMGQAGRARALERHSLSRQADLLIELFTSVQKKPYVAGGRVRYDLAE
jgi:hypothetical protein